MTRFFIFVAAIFAAGSTAAHAADGDGVHVASSPSEVEHLEGSDLSLVRLTDKAVERTGIETVEVLAYSKERMTRQIARFEQQDDLPLLDFWITDGIRDEWTSAASVAPTVYVRDTVAPADMVRIDLRPWSEPGRFEITSKPVPDLEPGTMMPVYVVLPEDSIERTAVLAKARIYDPEGNNWVYVEVEPHVYLRHAIEIAFRDGDLLVLDHGPALGAAVVVTGGMELYGTEFEIGH